MQKQKLSLLRDLKSHLNEDSIEDVLKYKRELVLLFKKIYDIMRVNHYEEP